MKQSPDETKQELPSAVDDAASVILESKGKEAFVGKNALEEKKSSARGLAVFVVALFLVLGFAAIFFKSLIHLIKIQKEFFYCGHRIRSFRQN